MGKSYGSDHVQLKSAKITHSVHAGIGRLIRAFAEIEDMLDLFIAHLGELSESKTTIILGKTAIARRIAIAEQLAALRTDSAAQVHKAAFRSDAFKTLSDMRNVLAHGTLLGKDGNGRLFFEASSIGPDGENNQTEVYSYPPHHIIANGAAAEQLAAQIERLLKVRELRAERLRQPLNPHPKAQPRRNAKS